MAQPWLMLPSLAMASLLRDPLLWLCVGLNALLKTPLLWLNEAEYTDGLILLRLFENRCPFYMPLYPLLTGWLEQLHIDPILAGRSVSLAAHVLTLLPLFVVSRWLTGSRAAALWTIILYSLSPVPCRWGIRVMTDSLFTLFWWSSLACLLWAAPTLQREDQVGSSSSSRWVMIGLAFGALAALTRQTGWLLLPPGLFAIFAMIHTLGRPPVRAALGLVLWILPFVWMAQVGAVEGHGSQVTARFTWLAALITVESYAVDWPLFVTFPVAILAVIGLVRPIGEGNRWMWFAGMLVWCVAGIIALQCLIQSYLERYLLPLAGFVCVLAGGALARLNREHPNLQFAVTTLVVGWLTLMTASVLWLQRTAWGDFREGALRMGEIAAGAPALYTNETYATWPPVGQTKAEWWSGHDVQPLFQEDAVGGARLAELTPGSLLLLSTAYGGQDGVDQLLGALHSRYQLLTVGSWGRRLTPLLPDLMNGPTHQNPFAVRLRHHPQDFHTYLLRIGEGMP